MFPAFPGKVSFASLPSFVLAMRAERVKERDKGARVVDEEDARMREAQDRVVSAEFVRSSDISLEVLDKARWELRIDVTAYWRCGLAHHMTRPPEPKIKATAIGFDKNYNVQFEALNRKKKKVQILSLGLNCSKRWI